MLSRDLPLAPLVQQVGSKFGCNICNHFRLLLFGSIDIKPGWNSKVVHIWIVLSTGRRDMPFMFGGNLLPLRYRCSTDRLSHWLHFSSRSLVSNLQFISSFPSVCDPCPPGYSCSSALATSKTACASGYYSLGMASACSPCPAGSYCPNTAYGPLSCPSGFYAPAASA